jgi:ISGsu1, transposase
LKLKRFLGRSANAVKLQLLCAMMAYLLLKLYQQCTTHSNDSLHLLCARIAGGLFEREKTMYGHYADIRRERREWIDRVQGRLI